MPLTHERFFGLDWQKGTSEVYANLAIGKKWREHPYKHGNILAPGEHLLRAAKALFTSDELCISPWTECHFHDWAEERFIIILGAAACSKSSDAGALVTLDWITDPLDTISIMASTSREALKMRSFEAVLRYHAILKRNPYFMVPGKASRTATAILNENDADSPDGISSPSGKACIKGAAVLDGGGNLVGAHLKYVRLIGDELSLMPPSFMEARTNLSVCEDFKFLGLANPLSLFDPACKFATPVDGWGSVNENFDEWRSVYGKVRHHDGMRSPAITEPDGATKYKYLIGQKHIDAILKEHGGNLDSPAIWTMIRGFPPPQGTERTVLTETELVTYGARDNAVWAAGETPVKIAALDAAYTADGDSCCLMVASVGRVAPGIPAIVFGRTEYLRIEASSKRPVSMQILDQVRNILAEEGIPITHLACDDSGVQGIADVLEGGLGLGITRYNYATKASEQLTAGGRDTYESRYTDKATEMWVTLAEFVRARQVRQLNETAASHLTNRRLVKRPRQVKSSLESKSEFRKRNTGRSPDEADCAAMLAKLSADVLGFHPGKAPTSLSQQAFSQQLPTFTRRAPLKSSYTKSGTLSGYMGRI